MRGAAQDVYRGSPPHALPVALGPGTSQMSTAAGNPIWPYDNLETLAALTRVSELFDCKVVEQQPHEINRHNLVRVRRKGIVVSTQAEADDVASLYAHLTKRRFMSAKDFARARACRPDVVVSPPDVLTPTFLRQLYSDPAWAPGLISAGSPDALLRQALIRAAAVSLCSQVRRGRVDVQPDAEPRKSTDPGRVILGRGAGRAQLRRALGRGCDLLTITSVGDGIDAKLGSLILCPMDRQPDRFEGTAPPCIVSGICHHLERPVAEALASGIPFPPEGISARVLILYVCWGIQPAGTHHSHVWGYGYRLADHDGLGAILTTWEVAIASPSDTEPLARDLERGTSLGRALARFNHSAASRRRGQLMCLLGDPDLRIPAAARASVTSGLASRPETSQNDRAHLAFLAAYLSTTDPTRESRAPRAAARKAVAECEQCAWSGLPIDATDEPLGTVMRQSVLEFLCKQGTIPAFHWMNFAYPVSTSKSGTRCPICDQPAREVTFSLRIPGVGPRTVQLCPRCGVTEDRPASMARIGFTVADEMACLHSFRPQGGWAAALLFRPRIGDHMFRPWPAGEDHKPLPAVVIPRQDPTRHAQLLLFVMQGAGLGIARAPSAAGP